MFALWLKNIILTLPKKLQESTIFTIHLFFFLYFSKSNLHFSLGKEKESIFMQTEILTKETGKMIRGKKINLIFRSENIYFLNKSK